MTAAGHSVGPLPASDPAPGGLTRLDPADGLLLRAEHLDRIQTYARALAHALGQAGGPGVVHGYRVGFSKPQTELSVDPGLAFDPAGRPLLLTATAAVGLPERAPAPGELLVAVATGAETASGEEEEVFGDLCGAPVGGTARAYRSETVRIELRRPPMDPPAYEGDAT